MAINPRVNPKKSAYTSYGESAIFMGADRLGAALDKCLQEVKLIYDMPDHLPKDMVIRKLHANLKLIMGIPDEE